MIGEKKLPAELLPLFLPHFLWRSMAHVMCPFPLLKIKIDAEFVGVMLHMFSFKNCILKQIRIMIERSTSYK